MREKCEAEFLKVGDNTYHGKVKRVCKPDKEGYLWVHFSTVPANTTTNKALFHKYDELTFWKDEDESTDLS